MSVLTEKIRLSGALSALSVSHRRRQSLDLAATDIRRPEFPFWLTCTHAAGRP